MTTTATKTTRRSNPPRVRKVDNHHGEPQTVPVVISTQMNGRFYPDKNRPEAPAGDTYLPLPEVSRILNIKPSNIIGYVIPLHGLKSVIVPVGKINTHWMLKSDVDKYESNRPKKTDRDYRIRILKQSRERRAMKVATESLARIPQGLVLGGDKIYPRQLTPYIFSVDARDPKELQDRLKIFFDYMKVPEVYLHSIQGEGTITFTCDGDVVLWNFRVRSCVVLSGLKRIRPWDKLEMMIESSDTLTFGFSSQGRLDIGR